MEAVAKQTGLNAKEIWHSYSYAIGLQHWQNWWAEYNAHRQLTGSIFGGKVPEIVVSPRVDSEDTPGKRSNEIVV